MKVCYDLLNHLGGSDISCKFRLVLEGKIGKQIPIGNIEVNPGPKRKVTTLSPCNWNVNTILAENIECIEGP